MQSYCLTLQNQANRKGYLTERKKKKTKLSLLICIFFFFFWQHLTEKNSFFFFGYFFCSLHLEVYTINEDKKWESKGDLGYVSAEERYGSKSPYSERPPHRTQALSPQIDSGHRKYDSDYSPYSIFNRGVFYFCNSNKKKKRSFFFSLITSNSN